ncbi:MAG: hypothetical protein AB8G96_15140 [Phycisphaerales bacterium]
MSTGLGFAASAADLSPTPPTRAATSVDATPRTVSSLVAASTASTASTGSTASTATAAADTSIELTPSGPNAPVVRILRDDRVATLELDYEAGNPWTPFELGDDGLGPVGYRVSWHPLSRTPAGRSSTMSRSPEFSAQPSAVKQKITALRRTQIQPLENDRPYFVRVDAVNRFGEIVGDPSYGVFQGGDETRVASLREEMTGFFDDFNAPEGLPEERRWNTTFSQTNDPDMQAFFINPQFHSHTLVGTPRQDLFGDRGQTTHRPRNQVQIASDETRRIVFDIDGVHYAGRAIWYLDLVQEEAEITSHVTVGGGAGSAGHPSPGLRFSLAGQHAAVYRFNAAGEQVLIDENPWLEWDGVQTLPNVRRTVEIQLRSDRVTMLMDGVAILDAPLLNGEVAPGAYTLLWTAFGYNTMKVGMPYFLIHWDNFGFDGPASPFVVHNYRSGIQGTDLVRSDDFAPQMVPVEIPDTLASSDGTPATARLVFVRQMNNWDAAEWSPQDSVTVNGVAYPIPEPTSSATPPLGLGDLINTNAAYSTSIDLGSVGPGGNAPLIAGANEVVFAASRCAFHNVHIEVQYADGSAPSYTVPSAMHVAPVHRDFMKVGLPARIQRIGDIPVDNNPWFSNLPENFNASVSGAIDVDVLVNARSFGQSMTRLASDTVSASLAAAGENPGVRRVELWIRPEDGDAASATLLAAVGTSADVAAPQFAGTFAFDTTQFPNGVYELSVMAEDSRGILSLPDFGGVGEQSSGAGDLNGFYYPLHITIGN